MFFRRPISSWLAALAVLASTTPVIAGGGVKGAPVADSAYNWAGFYTGGSIGYLWGDPDGTYLTGPADLGGPLGATGAGEIRTVMFGSHSGYNVLRDRSLLGVEIATYGGFGNGKARPLAPGDADEVVRGQVSKLLLVTARLGYLFDPKTMGYVKGGFAGSRVEVTTSDPTAAGLTISAGAKTEKTHLGWTIGLGVERAISPNVSVGIEYDFVGLRAETHATNSLASDGVTFPYDLRVKPDALHMLGLRLNFKL
jgi:opacity protein-like surface antigen